MTIIKNSIKRRTVGSFPLNLASYAVVGLLYNYIKDLIMYKKILFIFTLLVTFISSANSLDVLSSEDLKNKVIEINKAQNKANRLETTVTDVDDLFSLYTDDFVYVHEVYGGTYTRADLYNNTVKYVKSGGYTSTNDRYKIVAMIPGFNSIAVQREQTYEGVTVKHLAVFEFSGDKVSRITEYWK